MGGHGINVIPHQAYLRPGDADCSPDGLRAVSLTVHPGGASHPLGSAAAPRYRPPCVVISACSALSSPHGPNA